MVNLTRSRKLEMPISQEIVSMSQTAVYFIELQSA